MTQLNQIIAIESGVKPRAKKDFALAQRIFETKVAQLNGISRTYHPLNEDGEKFPPESTRVQVNVQEILSEVQKALIRFFDVTLTKDVANTLATADIVVDGVTIAENVPPPTLLFLEKELSELLLFIGKIPVLDLGEEWSYDDNVNAYATPPAQTAKTKKVPRNHVKWAPPNNTFTQPAQVEIFTEDIIVGYWTTVKYSGALPRKTVASYQEKVIKLIEAVKKAREQANTDTVSDQYIGKNVFDYIFG